MTIAGRTLDVHLARFAATEGDVWLYDPRTPHCDRRRSRGRAGALHGYGLRRRLEQGARPRSPQCRSRRLIPGHGDPMDRADFLPGARLTTTSSTCGQSTAPRRRMRRRLAAATQRSSSMRRTVTMSRRGRILSRHAAAFVAGGTAALLQAAQSVLSSAA